jgi:hypothetical protein
VGVTVQMVECGQTKWSSPLSDDVVRRRRLARAAADQCHSPHRRRGTHRTSTTLHAPDIINPSQARLRRDAGEPPHEGGTAVHTRRFVPLLRRGSGV